MKLRFKWLGLGCVSAWVFSSCSLVTVPVKTAGSVVNTTVKTTGRVVEAPFKAIGGNHHDHANQPAANDAAPSR
jgi:hypothetical protein